MRATGSNGRLRQAIFVIRCHIMRLKAVIEDQRRRLIRADREIRRTRAEAIRFPRSLEGCSFRHDVSLLFELAQRADLPGLREADRLLSIIEDLYRETSRTPCSALAGGPCAGGAQEELPL